MFVRRRDAGGAGTRSRWRGWDGGTSALVTGRTAPVNNDWFQMGDRLVSAFRASEGLDRCRRCGGGVIVKRYAFMNGIRIQIYVYFLTVS